MVTIAGSAVGAEAELLARQLEDFEALVPGARTRVRRTPDAADQRHQLYVQWLNAAAPDPDVLQIDVIWVAELAAAGWILPLEEAELDLGDFLPAPVEAARWQGRLYAVPWFVDVGMLYWRRDLLAAPPASLAELHREARRALDAGQVSHGFVWPGARYEGLVAVFMEFLGAFGGRVLEADGTVRVDEPPAVRALRAMQGAIEEGLVPRAVLGWREEQTRFAFQNGEALFMRNWPYAYPLLDDPERSQVAGRVGVAPMPGAPGGAPTAALGGALLALNARSDVPRLALRLIEYLTAPERMLERARALGQYPARRSLYGRPELDAALPVSSEDALTVVERAVPRPVTPLYTELSEALQIRLHNALTGQESPREALARAAQEMRAKLARAGLTGP